MLSPWMLSLRLISRKTSIKGHQGFSCESISVIFLVMFSTSWHLMFQNVSASENALRRGISQAYVKIIRISTQDKRLLCPFKSNSFAVKWLETRKPFPFITLVNGNQNCKLFYKTALMVSCIYLFQSAKKKVQVKAKATFIKDMN